MQSAGDPKASQSSANRQDNAIETQHLSYSYPGIDGRPLPGIPPVVHDTSVVLPRGARCLLVGPNGAGKTTLLKILGGKYLLPEGMVRVLGSSPFHNTELTASGALSYLGGNWDRDIAFAGYSIPLQGDIPARKMIWGVAGVDPTRRNRLIQALDIDTEWRMHRVSDGQRRRVQICLGLLKPFQVLLLDEITVDLDVLGRADMLAFLEAECREHGATIVYATHIFDGLEAWPTHVMYLAEGRIKFFQPAKEMPELRAGNLLELVERWLRDEKQDRKLRKAQQPAKESLTNARNELQLASWSNGWAPGRMTASLKDSSNTVMRM